MKIAFTTLTAVVLAWTVPVRPAYAQDAAPAPLRHTATSPAIEVTPFVSLDSRGSTPIGAAISFPVGSHFSIESETTYRRGETAADALSTSANLLYALPRIGRASPYLATGAGLAQYGTPIVSREGRVLGTAPIVTLEVNAGGGLKVPVNDSLGMRTDVRWFKSFGKDASEHFRVSQGVSFDVGKR